MSLSEQLASGDLYNPYDFANPVGDKKLFAGRDGEIRDIKYYLKLAARAPRPINIVLTGPRSAGKTSLLNWIQFEAEARDFSVARVDLNESDADPFSLFYKIYDAVLFSAVRKGAFAGLDGPIYQNYRETMDNDTAQAFTLGGLLFPRHFASASQSRRALSESILRADLRCISEEMSAPCVLLFDECDVLGQSRIELEQLRNVFMNTPGYMLVFAGTPQLFPVMEDVFSPIVRQFKKIPVRQFSEVDDTVECITKPLRRLGIDPDSAIEPDLFYLAAEVHRLAAGRPYEIQLLCHYMFKRVEQGDARDMQITLDLLDDVRDELEKQESDSGRRSIDSVKALDTKDFSLLKALTEFRGNITELAARSRLFSADRPYSEEELREAYLKFADLGLLTVEDDKIVFSGDQFDEIYARYAAAANSVELAGWHAPFRDELEYELSSLLRDVPNVAVLTPSVVGASAEQKKRIDEALTALISPGPRATLPDAAAALYGPVIESFDKRKVAVCSVTLSVLDAGTEVWISIDPDEATEFLGHDVLVRFAERAQTLGGSVEAEIFEQDLPDEHTFIEQVRAAASPNQAETFADEHYLLGRKLYQTQDFEGGSKQFEFAYLFSPVAAHAVSAAHCRLLSSCWAKAETFAVIGRDLATADEQDVDLEQYCFATYDLAIARLARGDRESARLLLEEALVVAEESNDDGGFLAIPSIDDEGCVTVSATVVQELGKNVRLVMESIG